MAKLRWALVTLGILLLLPALLWFGYGWYMSWQLSQPFAGARVITTGEGKLQLGVYSGGDQEIVLREDAPKSKIESSSASETAPAPAGLPTASVSSPPISTLLLPGGSNGVLGPPILPPTRLLIDKIAVDARVMLGDNDNLPQFKGVGWLWGTGFPGFRGNMVLFGHLNGEFETFARLDELINSDLLVVEAMGEKYDFVVTDTKVVSKDDVSVLAPTHDYRATLITCTGTFLPATRDYSHRLIVTAFLNSKPASN